MVFVILLLVAALIAWLQIYVRRRIRFCATHFTRVGNNIGSLPPVQRWTLAVVARYLMPLELPVDSFRPPEPRRVPVLTSLLLRDWSVKDRASLVPVVQHLQTTGHRVRCAKATGRPEADFLAWDLMRAVLLVWAGFHLKWLTEAEFLHVTVSCGSALQGRFDTWEEAAESYESGLAIWAADGKVRKVAERAHLVQQTLLNDPDSPWKSVPWHTPLAATIAE